MFYLKNFKIMTKRFIFSVAAIAIMLVSCSQNEEVINITSSDAITLSPSTAVTRASITTKTNLEANFQVYATSGTTPSGWYSDDTGASISGANHHYLDGNQWNFRTKVKWPKVEEIDKYPMNFYAFYPTTPNSVFQAVSTNHTNLLLDVTIPQAVGSQLDIVATVGTATAKPATSNLTLTFGHILSKVNFAVTNTYTEQGDIAYVQAVGFVNINSKNTYNVMTEAWPNTYNTPLNYNYFQSFVEDGVSGTVVMNGKPFDKDADKARFFDGNSVPTLADANLMLLPQTPKLWVVNVGPEDEARPTNDEAYVRVMYRYEHHQDVNFIGFANAQDHPDIENSVSHKTYTGPLYVYAVFTYDGAWVKGKGFLYNIPLPGDGGGRLYDPFLYDDKGNRTDLEVPHGEVDKPIITSDQYIHLIPIVTDWGTDDVIDVSY